MTRQMTHYVGDSCPGGHRPCAWVAVQARSGVAHHLERDLEGGEALAECGQRIHRPDFDPPRYMSECGGCASHHYARETRTGCTHCQKVPRRRVAGGEPE